MNSFTKNIVKNIILNNVTLFTVDTRDASLAVEALKKSSEEIQVLLQHEESFLDYYHNKDLNKSNKHYVNNLVQ